MAQLVIIADDFTGALDTGVKFAAAGATTKVVHGASGLSAELAAACDVLIVNTESRHVSAGKAYRAVYDAAACVAKLAVAYLYKKTDSALRGNVGAELQAVLDATAAPELTFIPAYPELHRYTANGVHYINGKCLSDTVYARDPIEPMTRSYIPDILRLQTGLPVQVCDAEAAHDAPERPAIMVYNVEAEAELLAIAQRLHRQNRLRVMAGCAGFAGILPGLLGMRGEAPRVDLSGERVLIFCGSVNPVTKRQLQCAESMGVERISLDTARVLLGGAEAEREEIETVQRAAAAYAAGRIPAIETLPNISPERDTENEREEARSIADAIGRVAYRLLKLGCKGVYLVTGGDTLQSIVARIGGAEIELLREVTPGVVLSRAWVEGGSLLLLTKSGGFGNDDLFTSILGQMRYECETEVCARA